MGYENLPFLNTPLARCVCARVRWANKGPDLIFWGKISLSLINCARIHACVFMWSFNQVLCRTCQPCVAFDMGCNWYRSLRVVNEVCDLNGEPSIWRKEQIEGVGNSSYKAIKQLRLALFFKFYLNLISSIFLSDALSRDYSYTHTQAE